MKYGNSGRARLLGTIGATALIVGVSGAYAQEVNLEDGNYVAGINQTFNGFGGVPISITSITGQDDLTRSVEIGLTTNDDVITSTVDIIENTTSASLTGNLAVTVLNSDVLNDAFLSGAGFASSGTELDGRPRAVAGTSGADLGIATAQNVNETEGTVVNSSTIGTLSDNITDSTITVAETTQEGVGIFNRNTSTLISSANSSDASTALATSQNVTASSLDVVTSSVADVEVLNDVADSTAALVDNTQRAVAAGNVGVNTTTVEANDLTVITAGPPTTTINLTDPDAPVASATAGNVLTSSQVVDLLDVDSGPINATVDGDSAGFMVSVGNDVASSTVVNEGNTASALVLGNEVSNQISLSANSITTVDDTTPDPLLAPGAAAAVSNLQLFAADATATAMAEAGQGVRTLIDNNVDDSTVSTSENRIEANATGNTGANRVIVDANLINTSGPVSPGATASASTGLIGIVGTTGAGFELSSAQTADGSITATLADRVGGTGASVATVIGGDVDSSTVSSDGNTLQAAATGNEITAQTNEVSVSGTNVTTTTGLANFQGLTADVSAVVGVAGSPGGIQNVEIVPEVLDAPFTVTGTVSGGTWSGNISSFTPDQQAAFLAEFGSATNFSYDAGTGVVSFDPSPTPADGSVGYLATVLGTPAVFADVFVPGTPGAGGVTLSALGTITASIMTVDGNTTRGSVTGNIATNRINIEATNLASGSALTTSTAAGDTAPSLTATTLGVANADQALANTQTIVGSDLETDVAGTFAVIGDLNEYDTTDSTLSVSDNQQFATTRGNVVTNSIDLSATNMDTGGAISSLQLGTGVTVTSNSVMDVSAPAAMATSTLSLDRNRNESAATVNTASNTLDVTPTNVTSISGGVNVDLLSSLTTAGIENVATADFAIANSQVATGTVDAAATSRIINQDVSGLVPTDAIVNSTVSVDQNVTLSQGSANRATNTMALVGGASLEATGAILNIQTSDTAVSASVDMIAGIDMVGDDAAALNASSATVSGNAASARAQGNVSTNVLNASAVLLSANNAGAAASANLNTGNVADGGVSASYGVLNNQFNAGDVAATVTAQYGTALGNNTFGSDAILNSQMSAMSNLIQASSVGNSATNTLIVSALNHGSSTAAIGNEQVNTGNISALATASQIGSTTTGNVFGSTISVAGNTISSSAIGNSAISTLNRN